MHYFTTTAVLATLLSLALAGPVTVNQKAPTEILKRETVNDCEDSSFIDRTSSGSPLVSDCQQLAANIVGGGTWHLFAGRGESVAGYNSCIFAAKSDWATKIGNQDIIDLINSSVDKFQSNGLIGVEGYVDCQNDWAATGTHTIWWTIRHR